MNAAPRGLGKGLSALLNDSYTQAPVNAPEGATISGISFLSVAALTPSRYQPRTFFKEEALKELSDSIRKNGIMQPILVRLNGKQHEIIAGERRWRAAQLAGLETVPVLVQEVGDQQALELAIIENVQRQDLNALEEANGYQRLMDEFGYNQEEMATTIGKSRSHISNLLRLLTLPDEVKQLLEEEKITAGHARALITAGNPLALAQEIVKRGLNVRQAEHLAKGDFVIGGEDSSAPRSRRPGQASDADTQALENVISNALGIQVRINDRGPKGDIVLTYTSMAELDRIIRRLTGNK